MEATSVAVETKKCINLVRWRDNTYSAVTMSSTVSSSRPVAAVQRWSKREKKRIKKAHPEMIQEYNCALGGTGRMDQNIGAHRSGTHRTRSGGASSADFLEQ